MNVELKTLTLKYFKGKQNLAVNFNYPETLIMGENGTGKSTISDAWHWLLFGKDSAGRAVKTATSDGFELKTLTAENVVISGVDHEVIGELYCDGRKVVLRKVYKEDWVKPKGALNPVLKGHTNVCYYDGIPVDMGEYNRRVNDIVPEALFKLITNPFHYNLLHWTERRKVLIGMAGDVTDAEIALLNPEFKTLLQNLEGKSIADFKAKIGAEKATIKKEFDQLPTRISTVREGMAEVQDWAALQTELTALQTQVENIDIAIGNASQAYQTINDGIQATQTRINALKTQKATILHTAQTAEQTRVFNANQSRRALENEIIVLKGENEKIQKRLETLPKEREVIALKIGKINSDLVLLRDGWHNENAKEYNPGDGCLTCPVYGHECTDGTAQSLHVSEQGKARETYNQKKTERLAAISKEGSELNAKITALQAEFDGFNTVIEAVKTNEVITGESLHLKLIEIEKLPIAVETVINPEIIPDWVAYDLAIKDLEETMTQPQTVDNTELIQQKRGITVKVDALKMTINTKNAIANDERRIAEYVAQQQALSQKIADIEAMEYETMQFSKAKFAEVENRINSQFKKVRFKMFTYTIDGNEVEFCETLVNGVPYSSINTAGQINAGLDIINAICMYHNVCAPIFIDRRESVNTLIPCKSQIINLTVSKDKTLQIN